MPASAITTHANTIPAIAPGNKKVIVKCKVLDDSLNITREHAWLCD